MTEYLYFDGSCGISGDMIAGALADLGANRAKLDAALASLRSQEGFEYAFAQKSSYSVAGCDFSVRLRAHEHPREEGYHHHHDHRHLSDVYDIIDKADMTDGARALAKKIFLIVARAEAEAHACPVEEVHFHEVGALDSVVDIIAAAVFADDLGVKNVIVDGLNEGRGFVTCQHGALPVPVPAVVNIAREHGVVLRPTDTQGEMVTPTGIAVAAALKTTDALPKAYQIVKTGIGLGKRDFGRANFLRAMIVKDAAPQDALYVVETNVDDCTAEELGLAMEKLFQAGARDVHFEPCFMKKCRPAYMLRAIVGAKNLTAAEDVIFRYTTTIGLRKYAVERRCMEREIMTVAISCGSVAVKKSRMNDIVRYTPEYESVRALSDKTGRDFRDLYDEARQAAREADNA